MDEIKSMLTEALPKDDVPKALSLLKKRDMYNLRYLVWADLSKSRRGEVDANSGMLNELSALLDKQSL